MEERRKKQRQQEEWRRENLKRRKEEELKAEEERQDEIWGQQQRRESSRRAAQSRVQLDQQRQEDGHWRAGEEDNGPNGESRRTFHTTLVPVKLHKVSVQPTNLIFLDGYYKNPTAPRKIEIPDDEGVGGNNPDLGFSHSL